MWINRDISSKIVQVSEQFPAIVVTGARQVGKTSLLKKLFPDRPLLSLDHPSQANLANDNPEEFLRRNPPPIIIDEVQYAPNLFRYLKIKIDSARAMFGQYVLTGSQKFTLMKGVSESLSGRCAVIELETLAAKEVHCHDSKRSLLENIIAGGFPEINAYPERDRIVYFESYLATYLERDIRSLLRVHNLRDFERLVRACAYRSGQILNKSELAKDVGVSPTTINEWISLLEASNQIFLLEPWFSNRTKGLAKSPKLYMSDTGLLCHFLNIRTQEELLASPAKGAVWESYVCSELRKRQQWTRGRSELWMLRTLRKFEVDFLVHKGGQFHLIEAKYGERLSSKECTALIEAEKLLGNQRILSRSIVNSASQMGSLCEGRISTYPVHEIPDTIIG
jgi:predicted AAA+ superfamily ATPase